MNIKKIGLGLLLVGVTSLSSCSVWQPGRGYSLYKKELNNSINEYLETINVDGFEKLTIQECKYVHVAGKGSKKPKVDIADETLKEEEIQRLLAKYNSYINHIIYTATYKYEYYKANETTLTSSPLATDYFVYSIKNNEIEYVTVDSEAFYEEMKTAVTEGYVYGCIGYYDTRKL